MWFVSPFVTQIFACQYKINVGYNKCRFLANMSAPARFIFMQDIYSHFTSQTPGCCESLDFDHLKSSIISTGVLRLASGRICRSNKNCNKTISAAKQPISTYSIDTLCWLLKMTNCSLNTRLWWSGYCYSWSTRGDKQQGYRTAPEQCIFYTGFKLYGI
jgi:hypothetical protein